MGGAVLALSATVRLSYLDISLITFQTSNLNQSTREVNIDVNYTTRPFIWTPETNSGGGFHGRGGAGAVNNGQHCRMARVRHRERPRHLQSMPGASK